MNVLSLFDGMSCGRIALDKAGIKVDKYYASEICNEQTFTKSFFDEEMFDHDWNDTSIMQEVA
jgi:hypothetical protein